MDILVWNIKWIRKNNFRISNNNIIGICGYSKLNSRKHIIRKNIYKLLKNILICSFLVKDKEKIYKYNNNYDYLPEELESYFDGEITILIVDKDFRGKKLLNRTFEIACKDNINNIQILCDESCNYKFYEGLGCKKVYEKNIFNSELGKCGNKTEEKGFIYEKKLNGLV